MDHPALLVERIGAVARLTLDRPAHANALDAALMQALCDAADGCADDDGVRCLLITGAGPMFCAGGDIATFAAAGDELAGVFARMIGPINRTIARLATMDKPLVTAINGPAAGFGFSLAMLGDVVIAGEAAKFAMAYAGIGLTPDGGASWLAPRLMGLRQAQALALGNTRLSANEALRLGLVTRVVADAALADDALQTATALAAGPVRALGRTRRLLLTSFANSLETQLAAEAEAMVASGGDAESAAGVAAFVAKRAPVFH